MDKNSFGKNLKNYREKKNITQNYLAGLINVTSQTVWRWENGEREPSIEIIKKIASILDCSVDELLHTQKGKVKITLSYDWNKYEKGEINMSADLFELFLGSNGAVGIKGAGLPKTRKDLEELKALINEQIEIAFDTQVKRGLIPQE